MLARTTRMRSATFACLARALSPQDVVLQWVSPVSEFEHMLIIRTFLEALPHTTLWGHGNLMIAALNPLRS
jgi:hypothetical protein